MKTRFSKKYFQQGLCVLIVMTSQLSLAQNVTTPPQNINSIDLPSRRPRPTVTINPGFIENTLVSQNTNVLRSLNNALRLRDQFNIARAALIPSLNLNLILAISNPPAFLINSVSCLVPFLFPSTWYNMNAADQNFHAELMALHITKLNLFAMATTLANHIQGDKNILSSLEGQLTRLQTYARGLNAQVFAGLIPQAEADRADSELGRLRIDISILREFISGEMASLRQMLALPLETQIDMSFPTIPASRLEQLEGDLLNSTQLSELVLQAPERIQLDYAKQSAQSVVDASHWAFLSGCSGSQALPVNNNNLFNLTTAIGVNFGFGFFPQISLNRRMVRDIEIRERELSLELALKLESTLGAIAELKQRTQIAEANEQAAERRLADQQILGSVRDIVEAYAAITAAKAAKIAAETAIGGHRITLRRIGLEGRFLRIYLQSRRSTEITGI